MISESVIQNVAERAYRLMDNRNLIVRNPTRPVFYVWPRSDRIILVVDPELVKNQQRLLSPEFRHDLSTTLNGRKVVTTNSRGIFFQIAFNPPPVPQSLRSEPLDLVQQPSPFHIPIGTTRTGPLWLSLPEMDALLVGGSRRMGKTRWIHGAIQALIHGGLSRLYLWDGKDGMEFGRYAAAQNVIVGRADGLFKILTDLVGEMGSRGTILMKSGATSLPEYNANLPPAQRMLLLVLVIDEVAHVPDDCKPMISELIGRGGAYGIYPILATTYPGHKEVQSLVRANLSTRISLAVPTMTESRVILSMPGAERLPKVRGRLLLVWDAKTIEAQAFRVELPDQKTISTPMLTSQERTLVRLALEEADGRFTIRFICQWDANMTEHSARKLVEIWEARGWLAKDPARDNARFVTPLLQGIYYQTAQSSQTAQTTQTNGQSDPEPEAIA